LGKLATRIFENNQDSEGLTQILKDFNLNKLPDNLSE
jgi:hypothetical protein